MWTSVAVDVAKVNGVIGPDTYRRIAGADAVRHSLVYPGKTVIARDRHPLATGSSAARRVRHVNRAIGPHLHVTVNAAVTLGRIENIDARTESDATIIAPRTLGATRNVLRAIVNRVLVKRMRR